MTARTSFVRRTAAFAAAAAIAVSGPIAFASAGNAATPGAAKDDVPNTAIDITKLEQGPVTEQPWARGPGVFVGDDEVDFEEGEAQSLSPLPGGAFLAQLAMPGGERQLVTAGEGAYKVLAKGDLSYDAVASPDGKHVVWTEQDTADGSGKAITRVKYAELATGKVLNEQVVDKAGLEPTDYYQDLAVFTDPSGAAGYVWDTDEDRAPELFEGVRDISASGGGHYARQITGDKHVTAVEDDMSNELWRTSEYRIEEFSEDGQYAIAVDAESDGLGATGYTILDAETGSVEGTITTDLTTQVTAEDDGSFVFDASNDGKQALVRFRPNTDADPELVSDPADWPSPPEDMPYVLSHR